MTARLFFLTCSFLTLAFPQTPPELPLMPVPANVTRGTGSVSIDVSFAVNLSGPGAADARVQLAVRRLFPRLARQTAIPVRAKNLAGGDGATLQIVVQSADHPAPQRLGDDERYSLEAGEGKIRLTAQKPLGVLRGLDTFLELVQQNPAGATPGFSVPAVTIQDEPRFGWRGLSLDVSRHFLPLVEVRRTLDGLEAVKLNVLHWHLSDDEGFRVESKKYPRLQQEGSDGLYYTQAEIRETIAYARDRGIRIVPEFDMPGHTASWLPGYPKLASGKPPFSIQRDYSDTHAVLDPTEEFTYTLLDGLIGEMAALFPDEYFHIGGDEVDPGEWNANPKIQAFMRVHHLADAKALQAYFNGRVAKIVARHGKHMVGWDEVLAPDVPRSILIQSWRGQPALWKAARAGYQGILSAGYYLDLMYPASYHYSIDPFKAPGPAPAAADEQGETSAGTNNLAPGTPADLTPQQSKLILGGEAAMWMEATTQENLDSRLWPRLAAIAERFWSPASTTDVASMYRRLALTNHWLEWLGLTQRSNLELMRQRLAGAMPYQPLDVFASVLEPVKGYARHAERYQTDAAFNRLIDSIPPESNAAREFRNAVEEYLATSPKERKSQTLRDQLAIWAAASIDVRPVMKSHSLLAADVGAATALEALCRAGLEATTYIDDSSAQPPGWKSRTRATIATLVNERVGDLLIQIAPGVEKLVEAVPTAAGSDR